MLCGDDDTEQTPIVYDAERKSISLKGASDALDLAAGEFLRLRVFVDRSLVEVFANRRVCLSAWSYPRHEEGGFVRLSAVGGSAQVKSIDVWEMGGKQWPVVSDQWLVVRVEGRKMGELMITSLSVIASWSSLLQIITASENKLSRGFSIAVAVG